MHICDQMQTTTRAKGMPCRIQAKGGRPIWSQAKRGGKRKEGEQSRVEDLWEALSGTDRKTAGRKTGGTVDIDQTQACDCPSSIGKVGSRAVTLG